MNADCSVRRYCLLDSDDTQSRNFYFGVYFLSPFFRFRKMTRSIRSSPAPEVFPVIFFCLFLYLFLFACHAAVIVGVTGFVLKRLFTSVATVLPRSSYYSTFTYYGSLEIEKLTKIVFWAQIGRSQALEAGKCDFDQFCFANSHGKLFAQS